jgi:hypothetical protein
MVRALPVKVPVMFVRTPSGGNDPEYLVGMSLASAATGRVTTTAPVNIDLNIPDCPISND